MEPKCYGKYLTKSKCLTCMWQRACQAWTKVMTNGTYPACKGRAYIYDTCEIVLSCPFRYSCQSEVEAKKLGTYFREKMGVKTKMKKTEILKVKGDWQEVVDDARSTVGKEGLGHEPSEKFKREMLIAEHSPIRDISIKWRWKDIPHWVGVHWVRHKWECFVRTQRTDRTGVERGKLPQDQPQTFVGEANCQHLIDTARKRLCHQASPETREYMEDLKASIHEVQPELSDVLVPNCIYRCGCPESKSCGLFKQLAMENIECAGMDIQARYDAYNKIFWAKREKEEKDVD